MANTRLMRLFKIVVFFISLFFGMNSINSQSINVPPKLIATYNTHFSVSLGGDMSYVGKNGELGLIQLNGQTKEDNIKFRETAGWSINLGLDIYSPNGVLGIYIATEYNQQKYSIEDTSNQRLDSITSRNIEIPAYLKFRFGKTTGKSHLWTAVGGGYSIPMKTKFKSFIGTSSGESAKINLFKPTLFLSSILGYEYYLKAANGQYTSGLRALIYLKGNLDLNNRVNSNFVPFPESSIGQIDNLDIQFLRISFGIKFLFG